VPPAYQALPPAYVAPARLPGRAKPNARPSVAPAFAAPVVVPPPQQQGSAVKWITLPEDAPLVIEQGLPELAPALMYSADLQALFSLSQSILYDLAGEAAEQVTIAHDPDWQAYPEVGAALKDAGGGEECLCVASIAARDSRLWAVGLGNKWKQREQAARLALCVALAANTDSLSSMAVQYPDFLAFCEQCNITTEDLEQAAAPDDAEAGLPSVPPPWPRSGRRRPASTAAAAGLPWAPRPFSAPGAGPHQPPSGGAPAQNGAAAYAAPTGQRLPRDTPLWITIPATEMPAQLEGLSNFALAVSTDGKTKKGLYSNAERALAHLLNDLSGLQYHDDANWDHFPQVGAALKELAPAEECLTVAVCPDRDIWAVGVSMKGKDRFAASKAALAASLALQAEEMGEEVDLSEFPSLAEFVEEARTSRT